MFRLINSNLHEGFLMLILSIFLGVVAGLPRDRAWMEYTKECGRSHLRAPRIVNGESAAPGQIPWQAFLMMPGGYCGGVLIDERHVLTAAHCAAVVPNISTITVRLGEYDTSTDTEIPMHEDFAARRIIIHENFKDIPEHENDIALIQLDAPVSFKPHIIPICLPESGVSFQNQEALVSGWGRTSNSQQYHGKLQNVRVKVVSNAECTAYMQTRNETIVITEGHLCAGANSSSVCRGDSGGPLVVSTNGRAVLIGLAAQAHLDCEMPNTLGVYTNVSTHMQWIRANTDRRSLFTGSHWA